MVRLPMPGPADLLRLAANGYAAAEQALGLVPRVVELVGQLERIAARAEAALDALDRTRQDADALIDRAGGLLTETERVLADTGRVVAGADALVGRTGQVVDAAQAITGRADGLLAEFEPTLHRLAPIAQRLAETTSPAEVDALISLIDTAPELAERMRTEILPILSTMTSLAPDVRELLETTREFTEILGSLPGLGRIKRRVEERQEQHDEERAEIEQKVSQPDDRP